ncbi:M48 family metallopeptidase [Chlamydia sp. 17-3921]|uniref:M48 family metallopeptidase n=1 Tax=Chlamydia sp. 17-3921 TaxID=2675798 RepID=UPI001F15EC0A|nr:M48 family metallopeptidase [Chlamydia sp. 17-3921]
MSFLKLLYKYFSRFVSHHSMTTTSCSKRRLLKTSVSIDFSLGDVYDLQEIYKDINHRLFQDSLNLRIGWFGRDFSGRARRVVLGSFHEEEQLIRIHRSLDRIEIPQFFIEYLVYHEMVHSVIPKEYSISGRTIFHGKKFKEYEKRFPLYERAVAWEKAHINVLLRAEKNR